MRSPPPFVVRALSQGEAATRLNDLVLAWALDINTRKPKYILELDADHRGQKCGCECASCGAPLIAVNAAKERFRKRPHFRHPEGAASDQCAVLSARIAILSQFRTGGVLTLPRRRMSASARGLSGRSHEAWVESPTEEVRITEVDFRDRAFALLTLDDGRQLRVQLVGTTEYATSAGAPDASAACVYLEVDDPSVASLSPEELRSRLTLLPDSLLWCSHWNDPALARQAEFEAMARAEAFYDAVPADLDIPDDLDPSLKSESVLHYAVKHILAEARALDVPALEVCVEQKTAQGRTVCETWSRPAERLSLTQVRLEQRYGRVVPDVTARAGRAGHHAEALHIEVTVTHAIDEERLARIRQANIATLEIDLSRCGGQLDGEGLKALVLDEVSAKKWLHHPHAAERRAALETLVAAQVEKIDADQAARRAALAKPLAEVVADYRAALTTWLPLAAKADTPDARPALEQDALRQARAAMTMMAQRGYREAAHPAFVGTGGILSRPLSIEADQGIGYRFALGWGVLNAIRQAKGENRSNHTLYLMAAHVYRPRLTEQQQGWMDQWRAEVAASIRRGEDTYLRATTYDRLIGLLFPAMTAALEKPFGKRVSQPAGSPAPAAPLPVEDWMLRGPALEAWMKAHPESAAAWAAYLPRRR